MKYLAVLFLFVGCFKSASLSKSEVVDTYRIVNSSQKKNPLWLNDPAVWAAKEEKNYQDHDYFVGDGLDDDQNRSCVLAKESANEKLSDFLAATFTNKYNEQWKKAPSPKMSEKLKKDSRTVVQNMSKANNYKTFWQEREYRIEYGANHDRTMFACSVLVKLAKNEQAAMLKNVAKKMMSNKGWKKELSRIKF